LCWGGNAGAELGDPSMKDHAAPRPIAGVTDATAIGLGRQHACALRAGGDVVCWGGADYESFGFPRDCPKDRTAQRTGDNGREVMISLYCAAPLPVAGLGKVDELVHGLGHACALDHAGGVHCWGGMGAGELGNREHGAGGSPAAVDVTFPAPSAPSGAKAVAIAARGNWTCAALVGGTVSCWGGAPFDEMPAARGGSVKPVTITGLTGVTDVALGVYHACVILRDGGVRCWGYNGSGELGDGSTERRMAPVTPPGLPPIAEVAMPWSQSSSHTCARSRAGEVYCWGNNGAGQVQPGGPVHVATPVKVAGIAGATALALSSQGSCALVGGVPRCWGSVVAPPGTVLGGKPAPLAGLDHIAEIGLGETVACARRDDGSVWCWGNRSKDPAPAAVELGGKARVLAVAGYRAAAIRDDGSVVGFWLESDGKPEVVRGATGAADLALSGDHACALDGQGRVLCWGSNSMGQLGNPDQGTGGNNEIAGPAAL
ncbi:MAG TPA: hypothetical protein VL172_05650, partial [Kofleriaceae bacterium]|nr:hypothetical protein [Kofleriaceae bacterium]